jgi:hypothetical protein
MIGVVMSYVSHSQVWASGAGWTLYVGGRTNRAQVAFERELLEVVENMLLGFLCRPSPGRISGVLKRLLGLTVNLVVKDPSMKYDIAFALNQGIVVALLAAAMNSVAKNTSHSQTRFASTSRCLLTEVDFLKSKSTFFKQPQFEWRVRPLFAASVYEGLYPRQV